MHIKREARRSSPVLEHAEESERSEDEGIAYPSRPLTKGIYKDKAFLVSNDKSGQIEELSFRKDRCGRLICTDNRKLQSIFYDCRPEKRVPLVKFVERDPNIERIVKSGGSRQFVCCWCKKIIDIDSHAHTWMRHRLTCDTLQVKLREAKLGGQVWKLRSKGHSRVPLSVSINRNKLLLDTRIEAVEPNRVVCSLCKKSINLGSVPYCLSKWNLHLKTYHEESEDSSVSNRPSAPSSDIQRPSLRKKRGIESTEEIEESDRASKRLRNNEDVSRTDGDSWVDDDFAIISMLLDSVPKVFRAMYEMATTILDETT